VQESDAFLTLLTAPCLILTACKDWSWYCCWI